MSQFVGSFYWDWGGRLQQLNWAYFHKAGAWLQEWFFNNVQGHEDVPFAYTSTKTQRGISCHLGNHQHRRQLNNFILQVFLQWSLSSISRELVSFRYPYQFSSDSVKFPAAIKNNPPWMCRKWRTDSAITPSPGSKKAALVNGQHCCGSRCYRKLVVPEPYSLMWVSAPCLACAPTCWRVTLACTLPREINS